MAIWHRFPWHHPALCYCQGRAGTCFCLTTHKSNNDSGSGAHLHAPPFPESLFKKETLSLTHDFELKLEFAHVGFVFLSHDSTELMQASLCSHSSIGSIMHEQVRFAAHLITTFFTLALPSLIVCFMIIKPFCVLLRASPLMLKYSVFTISIEISLIASTQMSGISVLFFPK